MTNRQEVAKKWRETGERLDKEPPSSLTGTACITLFELLESAGIRDNNSYSDVFNRLAGLIDPTCHLVEVDDEGKTSYVCSSCGNFGSEEVQLLDSFNFCPVCGARVVRDEA